MRLALITMVVDYIYAAWFWHKLHSTILGRSRCLRILAAIAWKRAESPDWVDPNAPAKVAVFAAPKDIAPKLLLERYMHGEHETVWNYLIRLGPAARQKPYIEPRSRQNLIMGGGDRPS